MTGRAIAVHAALIANDKKGVDIVVYDVRGLSDISDFLVLVTAHSKIQIKAIVNGIERELRELGARMYGHDGESGGQWIVLDYIDAVIHVFSPEQREYYNLESLWGDAPTIEWEKPAAVDEPQPVSAKKPKKKIARKSALKATIEAAEKSTRKSPSQPTGATTTAKKKTSAKKRKTS